MKDANTDDGAVQSAADSAEQAPTIPPRLNNELLSCVEAAGGTITGCSEAEVKNYLATADYACRQLSVQIAELWKGICKTAREKAKDEKKPIVGLSVGIEINHQNVLFMDTTVKTSYSEKHTLVESTQEDLTQTEFALK